MGRMNKNRHLLLLANVPAFEWLGLQLVRVFLLGISVRFSDFNPFLLRAVFHLNLQIFGFFLYF